MNNIPEGFTLCDRTNGTPDLRNRFVVGAGDTYDVGDTGGMESVTLSIDQMPSHNHFVGRVYYSSNNGVNFGGASGGSYDNAYTETVGGGLPHENRPPYYALCYIMKVA